MSVIDTPVEELIDALALARQETAFAKEQLNTALEMSEKDHVVMSQELSQLKEELARAQALLDDRIVKAAKKVAEETVANWRSSTPLPDSRWPSAVAENPTSIPVINLSLRDIAVLTMTAPVQKSIVSDNGNIQPVVLTQQKSKRLESAYPHPQEAPSGGVPVAEVFPMFCCVPR